MVRASTLSMSKSSEVVIATFEDYRGTHTLLVQPGVSATLYRACGDVEVFKIGSSAAYSGFNFTYFGEVTKITANSIFVRNRANSTKRMTLDSFISWNKHTKAEENATRDAWTD